VPVSEPSEKRFILAAERAVVLGRPGRSEWVVPAVALLLLGGCQGAGAAKGGGDESFVAPTEGAIRGAALDGTGTPLERVPVRLVGTSRVVETNATGAFVFERLVPQAYRLFAELPGYENTTRELVVQPGQWTEIELTLASLPSEETFVDHATLDFSASVASYRPVSQGLVYYNQDRFHHPLQRMPVAVVSTARWETNAPTGPATMELSIGVFDNPDGPLARGGPPLTARWSAINQSAQPALNVTFRVASTCDLGAECLTRIPPELARVAIQQSSTITTVVFYDREPPPDFVAGD
jgi:hypothetical protein